MGITTAWVNERHEIKREVYDLREHVSRLATSSWPSLTDSVCLRFIEPWGDTTFNQSQIPVLLDELRVEISKQADPAIQEALAEVMSLVEAAVSQTHTYIKFIGD